MYSLYSSYLLPLCFSDFILAILMGMCLGKHCFRELNLSIAILNGTCRFNNDNNNDNNNNNNNNNIPLSTSTKEG